MKRTFVIFFLLLSTASFAAIERTINSLAGTLGNPIVATAWLSITDQQYPFPSGWSTIFANENVEGAVVLRYADSKRTYTNKKWNLNVTYTVVTTDASGSTATTSDNLTISYDPTEGIKYIDRDKRVYPGAHRLAASITAIDYDEWNAATSAVTVANGTTLPSFLNDVYFDLEMNIERFYNLSTASATTIYTYYQTPTNELQVAWNYIQGAESYDLEWLFIDAGDETYPYTVSHDFDWRNATRVNVPNQFYNIPLAFPRGILLVRVRGVGIDWDNYITNGFITRGEGVWTSPGTLGATSTYSGTRYDIQTGLLPGMNWSYSAGFAEDGKRMDGAEFYDGMLRGREGISTVNSDGTVIVGQTLYDFEGRPAASMMPYPEQSSGITFYVADAAYDNNEFDTDARIEAPSTVPISGGAGAYYSSSSSATGMDAAAPDAEGFPYSRVTYMNDGTNRPVKSSSTGAVLGMSGVNETQYFYGTPTQGQLDRLFGNEVGYASHYKKNFVIDPNGVVSVSYIDQSGNVIATALAGPEPDNLVAIDNPNGNPNTAVAMSDDLLVNNGLNTNGTGTESQFTLTVTEESAHTFIYVLNSAGFCGTDACYNVCADCVYDLQISIINAVTGDSVDLLPSVTNVEVIKEYAITADAIGVTITLAPGTYRIQKTLTLNQDHLNDVRADFIAAQVADPELSCVPLVEAVPVPCAADCHEACEMHYLRNGVYYGDNGVALANQGTSSTDPGPTLIADCKRLLCDAPIVTDPCELKYQAMKDAMSPGGEYFDNLPSQYIYNTTTGIQTINEHYNQNAWLSAHDQSAAMLAAVNDYPIASSHSFASWEDVRNNWESGFADVLVSYHPEFCTWNYFCKWECEYTYNPTPPPSTTVTVTYTATDSHDYESETMYDTDGSVGTADGFYWNPLGMTVNNGHGDVDSDNSDYIPYGTNNLEHLDPRFAGDCDFTICTDGATLYAEAALANYLTDFYQGKDETGANLPYYFSLWYVATDPDNIHGGGSENGDLHSSTIDFFEMLHGDGTTPGLISSTPTAGQVTPYQFFRSVYFFYRALVIEQGFAGDAGVATCRTTYADDDVPVIDGDGYLVADDVYPNQTPEGFTILYPRNPLIDIYSDGCSTPTGEELAGIISELVEIGASNPNEIDNDVPTDIGCTCQMLTDFAEARGITLTDYAAIAAALNDEFDPATDYTSAQVGNWFTTCAVEAAEVDDLVAYGYPEELTCSIDIGITNLNAAAQENCEQENLELATYNAYYEYMNQITAAANAYMAAYTLACLENITVDEGESFTVEYMLHEYYYTLYYYDQAGNLVKTVPPEGVNLITSTADLNEVKEYRDDFRDGTPTSGIDFTPAQHDMKSRYAYNSLQQPVNASQNESANPGAYESGETSFWYDYLGRMVVSQNTKQAAMSPKGYSYTLYDELGRVYEVGELRTSSVLTPTKTGSRGSSNQYYYFDVVTPTTLSAWVAGAYSKNDVTYTYYDEDPGISSDATAAFSGGMENLRNRVAAVVYDDDPALQYDLYNFSATSQPDYLSAYFYSYDIHGNVKQVVQETPPLKTHNQNIKTTTYEYDLVSGNVNAVHYQSGQRDEFHHRYEYDADNRLKVAYTSRDGVHWEKESKQFYFATGGVARVEIGDKTVQAMDYAFTAQGWLKGMNRNTIGDNGSNQDRDLGQDGVDNTSNLNRNVGTDAAGFTLSYWQADGASITADYTSVNSISAFEADMNTSAYGSAIKNQFNGNIAGMTTALSDELQYGMEVQGRAFTYDQLYRIKQSEAYHMDGTALTNNAWQTSYTQDNRYKEAFTYDWNGNIRTVDRYSGILSAGTAVQTDDLTYNYASNSNLLTGIDDAVTGATICTFTDDLDDQGVNNYTYDALGSMIVDVSERITDIEWNPYGKVKAVRKDPANNTNSCSSTEYGDADVEFLYTAGQQRLCKIIKPHKPAGAGITDQDEWIYYWYAYDAGGNLMGVYKQSFEDHTLTTGNYKVKIDLEENGVYGSGRIGIRHADDESDYSQEFTSTMVSGEFATTFSYGTTTPHYDKTHYNRTIGYKQYEVGNHLGNVLVTVSDKRLLYTTAPTTATEVNWYTADVISYSDYYAFGAMQTGRAGGSYRYGFNGKENDDEINSVQGSWQDYGMRMYDPKVGRFFSSDPLMFYYAYMTPYQFASNMPITCIDIDGMEGGTANGSEMPAGPSGGTTNTQGSLGSGTSLEKANSDLRSFSEMLQECRTANAPQRKDVNSIPSSAGNTPAQLTPISREATVNATMAVAEAVGAVGPEIRPLVDFSNCYLQPNPYLDDFSAVENVGNFIGNVAAYGYNAIVGIEDFCCNPATCLGNMQRGMFAACVRDGISIGQGTLGRDIKTGLCDPHVWEQQTANLGLMFTGKYFPTLGPAPSEGVAAAEINAAKGIVQVENVSGSYLLEFESGKFYVGKGLESRMKKSIRRIETTYGDKLVRKTFYPASSSKAAFINEHNMMIKIGLPSRYDPNSLLYNKIWSPGKKILTQ